ncbi:hypothetical protein EX30DRAFT_340870 [Ascodesmis nigricans]|uniref:Uncharacterized protein n=1 Tax=Ascodesmis nigricans TaxID=341454 RepID=A0A4S2MXD7_9PEZI|nr:hypothetical protein EX30DRAFT_340870 [Ascodesmis nigricans]
MTSNFDVSTWGKTPPSLYDKLQASKRQTAPTPLTEALTKGFQDDIKLKSSRSARNTFPLLYKRKNPMSPFVGKESMSRDSLRSSGTEVKPLFSRSAPLKSELDFVRNMKYRDADRPHSAVAFFQDNRKEDGYCPVPEGFTKGWKPMIGGAAVAQGWLGDMEREPPPGLMEDEWWVWI